MRVYRNEYFRLINLFIFTIMLFWCMLSNSINQSYFPVCLCYILCNIACTILTKEVFFAWPTLIIRATGLFRYLLMGMVMNGGTIFKYSWLMIIELVAEYFVFFLFANVNKNNSVNEMTEIVLQSSVESTRVGLSSLIIILSGGLLVFLNRDVLSLYFSLSTSKVNVVYANGLIGLIVSAFFLILFIKAFEFIDGLSFLPRFIRVLLILSVSIFYINGIAVSSGDVSRWSMLIGAFVVYNIIIKFHPESKRGLLLLLGIVLLFTIVIGTFMKLNITNATYGINYDASLSTTLKNTFSYNTLNAYFAGPKNIDYAMAMINDANARGISKIGTLISDIFANFPLLNKFFSNEAYTSVSMFNYQIYRSTIAVDQIIPLCGQMYNIFGVLFFVPEMIIVYNALRFNSKIKREKNLLKLYCLVYLTFALSLVNCNNLNIMCQGLWIQILPVYLIYRFNIGGTRERSRKLA